MAAGLSAREARRRYDRLVTVDASPAGNQVSTGLPRFTAAEYRARAAAAAVRARAAVTRETWASDPGLRVQVDMILSMSPDERLRQLEAETAVFAGARLVSG
jgi:hypothetical protein